QARRSPLSASILAGTARNGLEHRDHALRVLFDPALANRQTGSHGRVGHRATAGGRSNAGGPISTGTTGGRFRPALAPRRYSLIKQTTFALGNYLAAADIFVTMESLPNEAWARLRAAEQLVNAGQCIEADEQLHGALAFWRRSAPPSTSARGKRYSQRPPRA